ncbi:SRPBCC family protein [Mycetocola miduiensis]|uniref:Carbon monoxide dehydrogenase subunit G n=1 Tax=Mycetocola miduiensis TaxID=995034 RepID=A0A1I5A609_9MICO|nr:SRPBCC family protein [Mycetocola miduiensis]SFN57846.1 Carbon monoxide dehydrogenase subunit G [Mycetocola miduiensis]
MPQAFRDEQTILAPPHDVWATLTDWSAASDWMPGVSDMRAAGDIAVGAELTFTARGKTRSSTVTALEPGRLITMSSTMPGVLADYTYSLEPAGNATTVSLVADVQTSGSMKLLGRVIRSAIAKEDAVQLTRLKALVESR